MGEFKRETAIRLPLSEFEETEYFKGEKEFESNYVLTKTGFRASRVNVWGNAVRKYESEKEFKSICLDDFSGCIDVNVFKETLSLFDKVGVGDVVEVIGKIRQGNNGLYILAEIVRKISSQEEMLKRLENLKSLKKLEKFEKEEKTDEEKDWKEEETEIEIEKNLV